MAKVDRKERLESYIFLQCQDITVCQSSVLINRCSVRQSAQLDDYFSLLFSFQGKESKGGRKEKVRSLRRLFFSSNDSKLSIANQVF